MSKRADKIVTGMAAMYIVFPIVLFFAGWLKLPFAILCGALIIFMAVRMIHDIDTDEDISITDNKKFWLTALGIIALWALMSGIGGFSFQTGDFIVRNPMFRDLERYKWPVMYNLDNETDLVRQFTGASESAMYVYYFTWWLPAALVARFLFFVGANTGNIEIYANIALYLWTVLGLFLTFYCLVRYLKKYSYWILSAFILFGGLDFIAFYIINMRLPVNEHIEWWAGGICNYFEYSANTTQLFWVFNQSVPMWLIVAMLLLMNKNRSKAAWASLSIAYSPYATIGMVPIAIYSIMKKDDRKLWDRIKAAVSIENIAVTASMAVVFVSFYYMKLSAGTDNSGFLFALHPEFRTFTIYVLFILIEFLIYFFVMGKDGFRYSYYWLTLVELLLFPLYKSGMNNDFTMRASIPALFILMVLCLQYVFDKERCGELKKRKAMLVCLCIGYLVSVTEIQRNTALTLVLSQQDYIIEDVYSFGSMRTDNEFQIQVNVNQYMALEEEYKDSVFCRYLMRK